VPVWTPVGLFAVPVLFLIVAVVQRLHGDAIIFPGESREFESTAIARARDRIAGGNASGCESSGREDRVLESITAAARRAA
jgi:hypothetical protein